MRNTHEIVADLKQRVLKRGLSLADLWPAMITVAALFILVIVMLVLFGQNGLGGFFDAGSAEANATEMARDKFIAILPMLGLVLMIVILGAVLGIVIGSFYMGGNDKRA